MVAERTGRRWRITGVFDLMEAYFGDSEADLSRTLAHYGIGRKGSDERAYAFLDAYFRSRKDPKVRAGFRKRLVVYMLIDRMIIWAYGRGVGWFDGYTDFRSWCEPQLILKPEYTRLLNVHSATSWARAPRILMEPGTRSPSGCGIGSRMASQIRRGEKKFKLNELS